jgi:Zn-dependent protease with chaperone function
LPPLLLVVAQDGLQALIPELKDRQGFPALAIGVLLSLMATAIVGIPWLLRLFLGLKPLPAGTLRDHLTATARRLHFRFSDILVWDTRGAVANALVTGMLPVLRYVVLTDRIIADLEVDEIKAVFGHEVGHIKHHHMTLYSVFLLFSLIALGGVWALGVESADARFGERWPWLIGLLERHEWFLLIVGAYVFLVFGILSRHCERQADLFGCNVSSRPAFIRALEKVADINGLHREKPGIFTAWQHWTIGQRVDFLRRLETDPDLEARTQRRIGLLKWSLTLGLLACIVALLSANPWNWIRYL